MPLNSFSTQDSATTFYFLFLQVTRLSPMKVKYLDVGFLLVVLLVQSTSVYPLLFR